LLCPGAREDGEVLFLVRDLGRAPDVDGQDVEGDGGPVAQVHDLPHAVDLRGLGVDQPHLRGNKNHEPRAVRVIVSFTHV
jgi:hypothetical protein